MNNSETITNDHKQIIKHRKTLGKLIQSQKQQKTDENTPNKSEQNTQQTQSDNIRKIQKTNTKSWLEF